MPAQESTPIEGEVTTSLEDLAESFRVFLLSLSLACSVLDVAIAAGIALDDLTEPEPVTA